MTNIERIQRWYSARCDGDWEHHAGVEIGTLDNPGWYLKIDLRGTALERTPFPPVSESDPDESPEWVRCHVCESEFEAFGGPFKLDHILRLFLDWADRSHDRADSQLPSSAF